MAVSVEDRLTALERDVAELKIQATNGAKTANSGWDAIFGTFADCPEFAEAVRLGREYRNSLPPDIVDIEPA